MATDVECFFQLLIIILVYSFFCELSVWIFCSFSVELSCYCWVGGEDPLEKGMATHSSILAWRILCTNEPGGLQSMGSQRVGRKDWVTNTFTFLGNFYIFRPQVLLSGICFMNVFSQSLTCLFIFIMFYYILLYFFNNLFKKISNIQKIERLKVNTHIHTIQNLLLTFYYTFPVTTCLSIYMHFKLNCGYQFIFPQYLRIHTIK